MPIFLDVSGSGAVYSPEWPCTSLCQLFAWQTAFSQNALFLNLPSLWANHWHGSCGIHRRGFLAGLKHRFHMCTHAGFHAETQMHSFIHTCTRSLILAVGTLKAASLSWGFAEVHAFFKCSLRGGPGLDRDPTVGGHSATQPSFSLATC